MSSDSTIDDVDEIVESNNLQCLASYSSFLVLNIVLWSFQSIHLLVSHLRSLSWSSRWILVLLLFLIVWSLFLSPIYLHLWG